MTTMVRDRVTHHLELGETEDSKTKVKYVHCTYPNGAKISELNKTTVRHPDTRLSISMQDDIVWTSDKPFSIDWKSNNPSSTDLPPRAEAEKLFFRNTFPWNSVKSEYDHKHRVHSGALDPSAQKTVEDAKGRCILLKFTATRLVSTNGPRNNGVKVLDPHVIVDP